MGDEDGNAQLITQSLSADVERMNGVLHLEKLWAADITITTGLVDTRTTPLLLRLLAEHKLDVSRLCTHRFGIDEMQDAYDAFSRAGETGALKVACAPTP